MSNVNEQFDPDVWHTVEGTQVIVRGNPWLDTHETVTPEYVIDLERQLAEAYKDTDFWTQQAANVAKEHNQTKAALAKAVNGLKKIRDYADQHVSNYSHICNCYWPQELREQAKDALASIEALTVQPEVKA